MSPKSLLPPQEGINFVICQICGTKLKQINYLHLFSKHGITIEEYRQRYPDSPLTSESTKKKISQSKTFSEQTRKTITQLRTFSKKTRKKVPKWRKNASKRKSHLKHIERKLTRAERAEVIRIGKEEAAIQREAKRNCIIELKQKLKR